MKKYFFNKAQKVIIVIGIFLIVCGLIIDLFSLHQHNFVKENKNNIVTVNAKVSEIREGLNSHVDDSDNHEYSISLSYWYNGSPYFCNGWKKITGDSYNDIRYKKGDTVKVLILSTKPDKILSMEPDDIDFYLKGHSNFMFTTSTCIVSFIVYAISVMIVYFKTRTIKL